MVTSLPSETTPKLDQREQSIRFFESRSIEEEILSSLKHLYEDLIKGDPTNIAVKRSSLEVGLQRRVNEMRQGSGGVNEAFNRLLGSGIMKDLPQIEGPAQNTSGFGVEVIKRPASAGDTGSIEVMTFVGNSPPFSNCRFTFGTSLDAVNKRVKDMNQENEAKRRELYGS